MSEIYDLVSDIAVNSGSVVSKRIFKCENAHVDLYALDSGEELDDEMLFHDTLTWILDGSAKLFYNKSEFRINSGDSCLIETGVWRKFIFEKPTKMLSINFKENIMIDHLQKASIFALADAIEYQDGKIVSKTLSKNENGNMSLLSFQNNQELATHAAPGDALVIALDGEALITIDGKDFNVKKHDSIILPGKVAHALKIKDKFKMLLIVTRD